MIERPVEEVFDFVTDARNEPRYNPRILNVEKKTAGPIGSGTRFVLVSEAMGRRTEVEFEITAYERPFRMTSRTIRGLPLMDVESAETFEPVAEGTRMRWEWEVRPRGAAGRLIAPVLARVLARRLKVAFINIKRVLDPELTRRWALSVVESAVNRKIEGYCYPTIQGSPCSYEQGWGFRSLLGAMWLQMVFLMRADRRCWNCGRAIDPGRNKHARFCDNNGKCRSNWNYREGKGKSSKSSRQKKRMVGYGR